jgi:hypothetical protein
MSAPASNTAPQPISSGAAVQIWTTEKEVGDHKILGKFSSADVYYYRDGQVITSCSAIKMIPSDGPVLVGEKIYLHNLWDVNYLCPTDDGYLETRTEPYAWVVQQ